MTQGKIGKAFVLQDPTPTTSVNSLREGRSNEVLSKDEPSTQG